MPNQWERYAESNAMAMDPANPHPYSISTKSVHQKEQHLWQRAMRDTTPATAPVRPRCCAKVAQTIDASASVHMAMPL